MAAKSTTLRTQSNRLDQTMTRLGKAKNDQFADYQESIEKNESAKMTRGRRLSDRFPLARGNIWIQLGRMISPKFAD